MFYIRSNLQGFFFTKKLSTAQEKITHVWWRCALGSLHLGQLSWRCKCSSHIRCWVADFGWLRWCLWRRDCSAHWLLRSSPRWSIDPQRTPCPTLKQWLYLILPVRRLSEMCLGLKKKLNKAHLKFYHLYLMFYEQYI